MSDEKREIMIKEIIDLCQSGITFDTAFRAVRERHGLKD